MSTPTTIRHQITINADHTRAACCDMPARLSSEDDSGAPACRDVAVYDGACALIAARRHITYARMPRAAMLFTRQARCADVDCLR